MTWRRRRRAAHGCCEGEWGGSGRDILTVGAQRDGLAGAGGVAQFMPRRVPCRVRSMPRSPRLCTNAWKRRWIAGKAGRAGAYMLPRFAATRRLPHDVPNPTRDGSARRASATALGHPPDCPWDRSGDACRDYSKHEHPRSCPPRTGTPEPRAWKKRGGSGPGATRSSGHARTMMSTASCPCGAGGIGDTRWRTGTATT